MKLAINRVFHGGIEVNNFVNLFKKYGYSVEAFGDSYIADNGTFCVPFTEYGDKIHPLISAVSFLSCDKENIKQHYKGVERIGFKVFSDWMNDQLKFSHFGGLGNHDHSLGEVQSWLERQ